MLEQETLPNVFEPSALLWAMRIIIMRSLTLRKIVRAQRL